MSTSAGIITCMLWSGVGERSCFLEEGNWLLFMEGLYDVHEHKCMAEIDYGVDV